MTTHLSLQRMLLPTAQVSSLTTGSITLPSARGQHSVDTQMTLISSYIISGSNTFLSLTNIPQIYKNLYIRGNLQETGGLSGNNFGSSTLLRFNGDSGSNGLYHYKEYYFWEGGTDGVGGSSPTNSAFNLYTVGNADTNNNTSSFEIYIMDYRSSGPKAMWLNNAFKIDPQTVSRQGIANYSGGAYRGTSPITSIDMRGQVGYRTNSEIYLYGYGDGT